MCREDYDEEWIGTALSRLVIPEDRDQCWGWRGVLSGQKGYPSFGLWTSRLHNGWGRKRRAPKAVRIHRLMYVTEVGPIKKGMVIDHLCNNPTCCNPQHLQQVTQQRNLIRATRTLPGRNASMTVCPRCGGAWRMQACRDGYARRRCQACHNQYRRDRVRAT
jgi:predicted RNA-binding Zn-ribbon protein involved in translation (DUF1610 family)